jgi:hypothetical protein
VLVFEAGGGSGSMAEAIRPRPRPGPMARLSARAAWMFSRMLPPSKPAGTEVSLTVAAETASIPVQARTCRVPVRSV